MLTIIWDCARAKSFWFGEHTPAARTPVLDSLAKRGTVFPRAVAPSNWTVPSHFSILTGTYPSTHGVRTFQRPSSPLPTTATESRRFGYQTSLFSENHLLAGFGLEDGFDYHSVGAPRAWDDGLNGLDRIIELTDSLAPGTLLKLISRVPPIVAPLSFVHRRQEVSYKRQVSSERVLDDFRSWLTLRSGDKPFYTFMNWLDTHDPYALVADGQRVGFVNRAYIYSPRLFLLAVPELRERGQWTPLINGYIQSIEEADRKLGRLLAALESVGELDRTLIIVTADHGQAFGEGGSMYHGSGAADSVSRVPLVVAPPRGISLPRYVDRWVSLTEIHSWAMASFSGNTPFDAGGHAPQPYSGLKPSFEFVYCEGSSPAHHLRSVRALSGDHDWAHSLLAAYKDGTKYVMDLQTSEISVWPAGTDPDETRPTRVSGPDAEQVRASVFGKYQEQDAARAASRAGEAAPVDVTIDHRLKSWGYE